MNVLNSAQPPGEKHSEDGLLLAAISNVNVLKSPCA